MVYTSHHDSITQWTECGIQYTHIVRLNGYEYWYKADNLHRTDGPAVRFGAGTEYYFLDGKELSAEEFQLIIFALYKKT
jgi:hypothetical protein